MVNGHRKITLSDEEISKQEAIDKLVEYHINEAKSYGKFEIDVDNRAV